MQGGRQGLGMRAWVVLLVASFVLAAGCASPLERRTPVVVVRETFEVSGGPGAAEAHFGFPCEMVAYGTEPLRVERFSSMLSHRPDFLVVFDRGDSWRAFVEGGSDVRPVLALGAASGGGLVEKVFGDAVSTGGSSSFGYPGPFLRVEPGLPSVTWREGRAWFGEEALVEGESLVRTFEYDVPTDVNGTLRVRHTVDVLYAGRVVVGLSPPAEGCRGGEVLVRAPQA